METCCHSNSRKKTSANADVKNSKKEYNKNIKHNKKAEWINNMKR